MPMTYGTSSYSVSFSRLLPINSLILLLFVLLFLQVLELKVPWYSMNRDQIASALRGGCRPFVSQDTCSKYDSCVRLMRRCWSHKPEERPSFPQIVEEIEAMVAEEANASAGVICLCVFLVLSPYYCIRCFVCLSTVIHV